MSNKKKARNSTSEPKQSRTFTFELYPEWSFFNDIVSHMVKEKYAMILHDKDVKDDGEMKKPHVHVVVRYGGKRLLSSVKNEYQKYGLENRFVDTCNERAMLRYLLHLDDPDKYQYSRSEVDTNMKTVCETAWSDDITSVAAFLQLNEYIESAVGYIKQTDLNKYAIKNGLYRGLRAYSSQINNARVEHNRDIDRAKETSELVSKELLNARIEHKEKWEKACMLADEFGAAVIESETGKQYTITTAKIKRDNDKRAENSDLWEGLEMVEKK